MPDELLTPEDWQEYICQHRPVPVKGKTSLLKLRHAKAQEWYAVAGVPMRYRNLEWLEDAQAFVTQESIDAYYEKWEPWWSRVAEQGLPEAGGFYLYGDHDSCKTCLAVLTLLSICDFIEDTPDPLYLHAGSYVAAQRRHDERADVWLARAGSASFFVCDDVGSESDSDYAREQLTALLEMRVGSVYPSVYTGNIAPEDLADAVGGRIAVRILRNNTLIRI